MLPIGTMMHASKEKGVFGPASPTYLTRDEQARACFHAPRVQAAFPMRLVCLN
jgi:hypothetical protein